MAVPGSPPGRRGDRAFARQVLSGRRGLALDQIGKRALHDHAAAVDAGTGAHFDEVIGRADGVFVVLDHHDAVADVAQPLEGRDHLDVVFRVQPDARFVEHVEHAHQARANLGRQADALRLAARERPRAAVEVEIVEADAEQQREPGADLLQHLPAGVGAAARRLDCAEERVQLVEVHLPDVVDTLASDREQQPACAHPCAPAVRARLLDHDLVEPGLHSRVGFAALPVPAVVALDPPGDAVEADFLAFPVAASDLRVRRREHRDPLRLDAVEQGVARLLGQPVPGRIEREVQRCRQAEHHPAVPGVGVVLERLAHETAAQDAALRIRDQQFRVRDLVDAEPAARPARALGVVELEELGADVSVDEALRRAAVGAVEAFGLALRRALRDVELHQPVANEQGARNAGLDGLLVLPPDDEAIDDGVDAGGVDGGSVTVVALTVIGRIALDVVGDVEQRAVDDQPAAALLPHLGEDEIQILAVDLEDRRPQLDLGAFGKREHRFEDLARGAAGHGLAGARAVGLADRREEQVEVARDVGHRPDGRTGIAGDRLLLDRDHRGEAEDEIDVGLGDLRDEPLGERGERFHVAALPFGVDRVERQARLARAGQAGDDDQRVARDLQRDVLQVVNAGALDADRGPRLLPWRGHRARVRHASPPVAVEIEERRLLHLDVAPARQVHRQRRLADQALIGEVLAGRHDAADVEMALEMLLDLGRRARLAGVPQVAQDRLEHPPGALVQIGVDRVEGGRDVLLRLRRVEQIRIDGAEERRVERQRLRQRLAIGHLARGNQFDARQPHRRVENPQRGVLEVAARDHPLVRLVQRRHDVGRGAEQLDLHVALAEHLQPLQQARDGLVVRVEQPALGEEGVHERAVARSFDDFAELGAREGQDVHVDAVGVEGEIAGLELLVVDGHQRRDRCRISPRRYRATGCRTAPPPGSTDPS